MRLDAVLFRKEALSGNRAEVAGATAEEARDEEIKYYCARCHRLVTSGAERISPQGDHEHVVFNPAGLIFRILCFREAPGAAGAGRASGEFTWFRGYVWRIALCRSCGIQLGWEYSGPEAPPLFFGLIRDRLTTDPPPAPLT